MKRKKNKYVIFLTIFSLTISVFFSTLAMAEEKRNWPNSPSIQAMSSIVMDLNTGTVLIENDSTKKAYPASITKIMTALIALERTKDLEEMVRFPREAIFFTDQLSSSIGMVPGEELSMRDCLMALMLASANEVANAIAIHVGGSIEGFVELMNEKAAELNCVNTHFVNPNGLHDEEHYTCALDMAKIGREAIKNEIFKKIAGTRTYVIPETNLMKETRPIANHHQMINPAKYPEYAYEYCYAGKTGFTSEAGMTLVSFAKKGTMDLVCVVLKAPTKEGQFGGTAKLFNYCFKRFRMEQAEKIKIEYENMDFYHRLRQKDMTARLYLPTAAVVVIPKKCDIQRIQSEVEFKEVDKLSPGENEVGFVEFSYNGKNIGAYPILYKTEEEVVFVEDKVLEDREEIQEEEAERKQKKEERAFLYKLILLGGLVLIFLSLFGIFLYFKFRKRKYYIHKSLRKRGRRNRFR